MSIYFFSSIEQTTPKANSLRPSNLKLFAHLCPPSAGAMCTKRRHSAAAGLVLRPVNAGLVCRDGRLAEVVVGACEDSKSRDFTEQILAQ